MANCARCSAELIGSARFCATCGAPVATTPSGSREGSGIAHASQSAQPAASTTGDAKEEPAPPRPPPGEGSQVSPLAVSNGLAERGAFQQALENAKDKARASVTPPAPAAAKKPGTQLMQHAPSRPLPRPDEPPAAQAPAANRRDGLRRDSPGWLGAAAERGPYALSRRNGTATECRPSTTGHHGTASDGAGAGSVARAAASSAARRAVPCASGLPATTADAVRAAAARRSGRLGLEHSPEPEPEPEPGRAVPVSLQLRARLTRPGHVVERAALPGDNQPGERHAVPRRLPGRPAALGRDAVPLTELTTCPSGSKAIMR
jgi:hypothetical protein